MENIIVYFVVAIVGIVMAFVSVEEFKKERELTILAKMWRGIAIMGLCTLLLGIGGVFFSFGNMMEGIQNEKTQEIEVALENNYKIYINGREVEPWTIDVSTYRNIKIDNDKKIIIITAD